MSEPKKGGRRTKDQEIDLYLAQHGIDRAALEETGKMIAIERQEQAGAGESFTEMRDRALASLMADYESLSGVAKVQAFRAIQQLQRDEPEGGGEDEKEPLLVDVIGGITNLSKERKLEILQRELAKLDEDRAAILGVLND